MCVGIYKDLFVAIFDGIIWYEQDSFGRRLLG